MFSVGIISAGISAISIFCLGLFVFSKNPKNKTNKVFFLLSLALTGWLIGTVKMFLSCQVKEVAIFFDRVIYLFVVFIPAITYHLSVSFIETKKQKTILFLGYVLSVFFLSVIIFWPNSFLDGIFQYKYGCHGIGQFWHHVFIFFFGAYVLLFFINLIIHYLKTKNQVKKIQTRYLLLAFVVYTIGSLTFLPAYQVPVHPYFFFAEVGGVIIMAYAITRYRLMDIRFALGRGFIYLFSSTAVVGLGFLLMFLNNNLAQPISQNVFLPIIIIFAVLVYQLFFRIFEKIASRFFYYSFYSSQKVLTELGEKLVRILDISELNNIIAQTLMATMKLDRIVVLLREKTGHYVILKNIGFKEENGISLVKDNFLTEFLEKTQEPLVFEELSLAERDAKTEKEREGLRKLQGNMKSIEANVCLPLFRGKDITGIIILGKKVSGDSYSREDMELLIALTNQASIAIENARLYEQVKDLSENLQEKVAEQTKELQESYQKVENAYEIEKEAHKELKRIDAAKSQFIMATQHHLRTPLTALKGYLSMALEDDFGKLSQILKEKLGFCFDSTNRLIKLVNEFLDLSKLQLGQDILEIKEISITALLQDVIAEVKPEADKKGIYLTFALPDENIPLTMADPTKLREALYNLIDNAVKYTEKGGVAIKLQIKNCTPKDSKLPMGQELKIAIQDTGIGMTPEETQEVFSRQFERGEEAKKVYTLGRGIGLFIAANIIKEHKGKVWAESPGRGKGSSFYVELVVK